MGRAVAGLIVLVAAASAARAQPVQVPLDASAPEVRAAASPTQVVLGGRFTLFVTATFGPGVEVNLPEPLPLGTAFEVTRRASEDRAASDGRREREWQLDVTVWEIGDLDVPPVPVTFTAGGHAGQVATNPVPLHVTGALGDVVDDPKLLRGDAPTLPLESRDWIWLWIAAGAGAVVVVALAVAIARARRRRRVARLVAGAAHEVGAALDPASERALERLLAIERSGVLDRDGERKRGYTDMVGALRDYIAARYHVVIAERTTAELVRVLALVAPAAERARIEPWLERCDLVKYGGFRTSAAEAAGVLADARAIVVATTRAAGEKAAA
ncbi:MAG TPA: hypothetical protein VMJ10_11700 [Kofleriaceae bacterium]|nr:hypothetical protein [Kofleriaceae bacterium]